MSSVSSVGIVRSVRIVSSNGNLISVGIVEGVSSVRECRECWKCGESEKYLECQ